MEQLYFKSIIDDCSQESVVFTAQPGNGYIENGELHVCGVYHFIYKTADTAGWYMRNPEDGVDYYLGEGASPTAVFEDIEVVNEDAFAAIVSARSIVRRGQTKEAQEYATALNRVNLMFVLAAQEGKLDNTTILQNSDLFKDEWEPDKEYAVGDFRLDDGVLYKCIQAHHSQAGWNPSAVSALWVLIGDPNEEYPEWRQPRFREESYMYGQKCSHNEKKWHSTMDYNTFEPGTLNSHWEEDTDPREEAE